MDEVIGHDVAEPVDDIPIPIKENEFSFKPGSSNVMQSDEMIAPCTEDYPDNSMNENSDILDGRNLDRFGSSEKASTSPRCRYDAENMVSDLTLENYDGKKLAIAGSSNCRERTQSTQNNWQHLYQITGGSRIISLHEQTRHKGKGRAVLPVENICDYKGTSGDILCSSGGVRTKIISTSGLSNYFTKSSLMAKGVINKMPPGRASTAEVRDQDHSKPVAPLCLTTQHVTPLSHGVSEPLTSLNPNSLSDGINLREWLDSRHYKTNKAHGLLIFRRILDFVHVSHSRGVFLENLRPSCFKLLESCNSYQVTYLGSSVQAGVTGNVTNRNIHQSSHVQNGKRPMHHSMLPLDRHSMKKQKLVENMKFIQRWPQFPSRSGISSILKDVARLDGADPSPCVDEEHKIIVESKKQVKFFNQNTQPGEVSLSLTLEEQWYISPELANENSCTLASNIYCLGVLLFELISSFDSERTHAAAMQDLRHRILLPRFLSQNPKEAGFCLWLLHPAPSSRPTTREILQSEFISGNQEVSQRYNREILQSEFISGNQEVSGVKPLLSIDEEDGDQEVSGGKSFSSIDEEDDESELLSYFLSSLNEVKEKAESNLVEQIQHLESDIQEIEKGRPRNSLILSSTHKLSTPVTSTESKVMTNFRQLENAYFSMRPCIKSSDSDATTNRKEDPIKFRERRSTMRREEHEHGTRDCLGGFFDGLCKYARYNKFKVKGTVRNGEFKNYSANVMCLSFDRDEDYLAAGGVSKKIKVYEFQALFNDSVDMHYPAVEMANTSKISCVCWNGYIRNYLASSDYDGVVKLWDAATGQGFSNFVEHSERAWSVDFSRVDPIKLASGSDDRSVKIWSIKDKNSLCTIRSKANVCSVQFSDFSSHLLAFSSADKTYCYDLRNVSTPWCVLAGHTKAVSYAKFLDAATLVSASIGSTLKIWDLNKTNSNSLSRDACISTLRGHTNEKNFVGLSVANGYIACGSETNEVFAYYKSLSMPITSHKFGSIDPITGKETEDVNGQFVTSVCWRQKSNMVVAANSSGSIKLLQMA